jgi:hypothetical protein
MNSKRNPVGAGRNARILSAALCAAAFTLGLLVAVESLNVAFAAPGAVAEYHFGSESMVAHGGWHYRSRVAYVGSGLAEAVLLLTSATLLFVAARRGALRPLAAGAALGLATVLYGQAVLWLR